MNGNVRMHHAKITERRSLLNSRIMRPLSEYYIIVGRGIGNA